MDTWDDLDDSDVFYLVATDRNGVPFRDTVGPYHVDEMDALARGKAYLLQTLQAQEVHRVAADKLKSFLRRQRRKSRRP